jgi:class 3 adenylate cyclase
MSEREADLPDDQRIRLRIGVNLGDIIVEGSDIYGDGVNVAARLEALADPGGICISGSVFDQVKGKVDLGFEDRGEQEVKNIAEPVQVYRGILLRRHHRGHHHRTLTVPLAVRHRAELVLPLQGPVS